jgi:hypothetical protein
LRASVRARVDVGLRLGGVADRPATAIAGLVTSVGLMRRAFSLPPTIGPAVSFSATSVDIALRRGALGERCE